MTLRVAASIGLLAAATAHATEPLHDTVEINGRDASLFSFANGAVEMPPSEELRALRLREMQECSAIGGPVGTFEVKGNQLLLRELRICGGTIPLVDVFPNLRAPALATWLTGKYIAHSGYLCRDKDYRSVPEIEITMTVVGGKVVATEEKRHTKAECTQ